jgi:hypothetical protein
MTLCNLPRPAPRIRICLICGCRRNDRGENDKSDPYPAAMIFHCWLVLFVSLH